MSYQQTEYWLVDNTVDEKMKEERLRAGARLLQNDELVAFPTETVYGLGANGLSTTAVEKIYKAKGRPSDNPLILHIGEKAQLSPLIAGGSEIIKTFMNHFWPGPLTLVLPKSSSVPEIVTAGLSTVAVRMPAHAEARALIKYANAPIAAPSANRSGRPSPTLADHVRQDLDGRIAAIIDSGRTGYGLESTVLDLSGSSPMILRPGGVTEEMIEEVLGAPLKNSIHDKGGAPRSPGMKYRHYAPETQLILFAGTAQALQERIDEERRMGSRVGAAVSTEKKAAIQADAVIDLGSEKDLGEVSTYLYDHLRAVDDLEVDFILVQAFPREGLGRAIMNRLEKAAAR